MRRRTSDGREGNRTPGPVLRSIQVLVLLISLVGSLASSSVAFADTPTPSPSPADTTAPSPSPSATDASPAPSPSATDASPAPSPSPTEQPSASPSPGGQQTAQAVPIIVQMVAGLTADEQQAVIAQDGGTETGSLPALRLHFIDVPSADATTDIANYQSDPNVTSVDRDRNRAAEGAPSDPAYGSQWDLPQINWDKAFGSVSPSGTATIAVLDTGVASGIPDLSGRLTAGWSAFPGGDPNNDPNGHGTWMASIAAAGTDNGIGIAGVDYAGTNIMPVQVLDANGTGQDSDIINGVVWATNNGADVILMGFSNPGFSSALQDAITYAWNHGVVLVAATGNDASSVGHFPAGDAKVVGVSGTNQSDTLWSGSNYGDDSFIAAPAVGIPADSPDGGTTSITGTSAAAAIVAGSAALLKANDPTATNGVIVGRLARNADPAGAQGETGNGRVNLNRALNDTSTDPVVPAGAPPVGNGGPYVGPYHVATAGTIKGKVTNASNSAAISGATVTVSCTSPSGCTPPPSTTTNASGVYTTANINWPGGPSVLASGNITASASGFTPQTKPWSTTSGNNLTINFSLSPTTRTTSTTLRCSPASVPV